MFKVSCQHKIWWWRYQQFLSHQLAMPGENGVRFDDGSDLFQGLPSELFTDCSKGSTLGVRELNASFNLVVQDVSFGDEIVVSQAQLFINGARDVS